MRDLDKHRRQSRDFYHRNKVYVGDNWRVITYGCGCQRKFKESHLPQLGEVMWCFRHACYVTVTDHGE